MTRPIVLINRGDVARSRLVIDRRSLETSLNFWVRTSNFRQDSRLDKAVALLTNRGLAGLEHRVLRLREGGRHRVSRANGEASGGSLAEAHLIGVGGLRRNDIFHHASLLGRFVCKQDWRHSLASLLISLGYAEGCSAAPLSMWIVDLILEGESLRREPEARIHRLVDTRLVHAVVVHQVDAAALGSFYFRGGDGGHLSLIIEFQLIDLPLKARIDGLHASVTVYSTRALGHGRQHGVVAGVDEAAGSERLAPALAALDIRAHLRLNHGHGDV